MSSEQTQQATTLYSDNERALEWWEGLKDNKKVRLQDTHLFGNIFHKPTIGEITKIWKKEIQQPEQDNSIKENTSYTIMEDINVMVEENKRMRIALERIAGFETKASGVAYTMRLTAKAALYKNQLKTTAENTNTNTKQQG